MTEPTPIRRRYTKAQKAALVGMAEVEGTRQAAARAGVPESSIRYWRQDEEFARLRAEKQEEVALDVFAAFQLGVRRVVELIPKTDDLQKVATATGIIYDKYALISGRATSRSETTTLTDGMDDHEREALREILREAVTE